MAVPLLSANWAQGMCIQGMFNSDSDIQSTYTIAVTFSLPSVITIWLASHVVPATPVLEVNGISRHHLHILGPKEHRWSGKPVWCGNTKTETGVNAKWKAFFIERCWVVLRSGRSHGGFSSPSFPITGHSISFSMKKPLFSCIKSPHQCNYTFFLSKNLQDEVRGIFRYMSLNFCPL